MDESTKVTEEPPKTVMLTEESTNTEEPPKADVSAEVTEEPPCKKARTEEPATTEDLGEAEGLSKPYEDQAEKEKELSNSSVKASKMGLQKGKQLAGESRRPRVWPSRTRTRQRRR